MHNEKRYPIFPHLIVPYINTPVNNTTSVCEEIFAPVMEVILLTSTEETLAVASDIDYGLHATVFTHDIDRAILVARSLPCGKVSVNGFS